ncbi:MAG TPA: autotransporter outer membrane beta-barrel domain-containing protein [Rhizomicrobium sp.]|nr:autotransporter outer membrane beta-barrel domain-containing protein [Rhizomicrobium sp.]
MIKHRLMLSAAAAALLTVALAVVSAHADTEISTSTSTALSTSSGGNIVIDATGAVNITQASVAAITINSANTVSNTGSIANANTDSGIGVLIDTTAGNILSSNGLTSTGAIDVGGNGTNKRGIVIQGGNTFYGPVTLTTLIATSTLTGTTAAAQSSAMIVQGDNSAAFLLVQGTKMTSNILLGGGGIVQNASTNSTQSNSIMVDLDGTLNGNLYLQGGLSGVGPGLVGVQTLGGIHSCANDTARPSGFTCPASSGGSLVNAGSISLIGTRTFNTRGNNAEAGSAVVIGGSIDGGFLNTGPGTSNNVGQALISSSGLTLSGVSNPTLLIDPTRSITGTLTAPRGPVILGPVTADIDSIDPGYSFINRGTITAQPIDPERGTATVVIQGASSAYFTCLGTVSGAASNNACITTKQNRTDQVTSTVNGTTIVTPVTYTAVGGLLNTGTISAQASTNSQTVTSSGITSASALYVGPFATISRLDVKSEAISGSSNTAGKIVAQVGGIGGGSAFGVILGQNSNVPVINVGQGGSIVASVATNTIAPTKAIATTSSPFSLVSEAILDQGGSLKTINNAGLIQAANTTLIPDTGAVTTSITDAIDLSAGTTGGVTINNSGHILGNVLVGAAGNNNALNVGNIGASGTANPATGLVNTPSNYAVVAQAITSDTVGLPPLTTPSLIDFGSGTGHSLHVGGFGYVNAVINSGASALAVQVDSNGLLFISNTTSTVQASTFNVASNGTLGLAISQSNLNSLNPVVQANSANLSGALLAVQFGTYVSSGFTAASTASPTSQTITLIRAPVITDTTLAGQNAQLGQNTPFLFETPAESGLTSLSVSNDPSGQQVLQLHLLPRSTGAKNRDGSPGLNLSGEARSEFPLAAAALATDDQLGAAIATSLTVYNTPGAPGSGINVAASQQQAQQVFSQFAPDVSGGAREVAIMLTDQASGPVASRQRLLHSYANVPGDMTLWGEEFTGQINNKGRVASDGTLTSYKDHGFGFVLGVDGGSPRNGWYGGAFTFYSGDITQQLPRATRTNTQWYMLTGYTDWRGKHIFLDTQISAAYGDFQATRSLNVGGLVRNATSRRPGAMLALGANTGAMLKYSGFEIDPHISLDAMTLREEGYQEANGGPGLNLDVAPYFASSLRTAVGADIKTKITIWNFDLTPEARLGYRYDLVQDAVKIKAAFEATGGRATAGNTMTFVGPDPDSGNAIAGLSLGASTDTWQLGVNYDWIRGNNGSTTQVGIITVLGRI